MIGNPVEKFAESKNIYYIKGLNNRVVNTSRQRVGVMYTFALYQMLASLFALLYIIYKNKLSKRYKTYRSS